MEELKVIKSKKLKDCEVIGILLAKDWFEDGLVPKHHVMPDDHVVAQWMDFHDGTNSHIEGRTTIAILREKRDAFLIYNHRVGLEFLGDKEASTKAPWYKYPDNKPQEEGYYNVCTLEFKIGVALWKLGKWWDDVNQDTKTLMGLKHEFILYYAEISELNPVIKKDLDEMDKEEKL
jgi:hypothetical protein